MSLWTVFPSVSEDRATNRGVNVFGERYVVLLGNGTLGQDCYFGGGEYSVRVLGVGLRYMFMGLNLKCPLLLSVR